MLLILEKCNEANMTDFSHFEKELFESLQMP